MRKRELFDSGDIAMPIWTKTLFRLENRMSEKRIFIFIVIRGHPVLEYDR